MSELPPCPSCSSPYTYQDGGLFYGPKFGYEWSPSPVEDEVVIRCVNGNFL